MSIQEINGGLYKADELWQRFVRSSCSNSASDRTELMRLQDDLTDLRNHLNSLNEVISHEIKEAK
jgi:hypothetical protein